MKKLLVLPFSISLSSEYAFLSEEYILEELIDQLLQYPSLQVCSKSTSFYLHQNPLAAPLLKREYSIDMMIEGGIKQVEEKLVISYRLISTEEESILLKISHSFDKQELQTTLDNITTEVYQKMNILTPTISSKEEYTKAEELYNTGLVHWNRYTHKELKTAIKHFKNAINHDQNFVLAYAAIADCYCVIGVMGFDLPKIAFQQAQSYIEKALLLDNKRSDIFVSAALINIFLDRDYSQAKTNLTQALLLNKRSTKANHTFAMYAIHQRDLAAAEKYALFNIRNAPLEIPHYDMIARIYLYKKEFEKGLSYIEKALQIDSDSVELKELEGHLNLHLLNYEKAIECYQICLTQNKENPLYHSNLSYLFSKSNYHMDSRKIMDDMENLKAKTHNSSTYHYALSIIKLGQLDYDSFFKHITIAFENGLGMFIGELICNPIYNEIRQDERFRTLIQKLNLEDNEVYSVKKKLPSSTITLSTKTTETLSLDPQHIAFIESQGNYTKIYWFDNKILKNKLLRVPLTNIEQQLNEFSYLQRCHKSYMINLNEPLTISGNSKGYFFESNYYPRRIPISRKKSNEFIDTLKKVN